MTGREDRWTVGDVARLAHVSVRTLHHYDEIGLLVPPRRDGNGYREYGPEELERLHQILLFRELGFGLDAIAELLDAPPLDRRSALRAQRELLTERVRRTEAVIRAVDATLDALERGETMSREQLFDGFDALANAPAEVRAHQAEHGREAQDRWADTDAYRESMRRARDYSKSDWQRMRAESEALEATMARLHAANADPEGAEAVAGAEALRLHIGRWFYDCSRAMHAALADMYEADPRFRAHYERRAAGLAAFVATAIRANAAGE